MTTTNKEFADATFGENAALPTTAVAVMEEQTELTVQNVELLDFSINEQAESLIASLDSSNQEAIELTASYLNWDIIEPLQRLIYVGSNWQDMVDPNTGEIEQKRVAYFIDENKNKWFSMATKIIGELSLIKAPAPVEIHFKGKKKSNSGRHFHDFSIKILRPVKKLPA